MKKILRKNKKLSEFSTSKICNIDLIECRFSWIPKQVLEPLQIQDDFLVIELQGGICK